MELYGSYVSPYVRHCRIVLLETGQDCSFVETDHATSAVASPTKRMPFLRDGDLTLTDSASILKYLRGKAGQDFLSDVTDYDYFCMVNTALDATANLFMLEKDGITPEQSAYLTRQSQRIDSTLAELNKRPLPAQAPYNDAELRLACYLAWGLFRQRINFEQHKNLLDFLKGANRYEHFRVTAPPQS